MRVYEYERICPMCHSLYYASAPNQKYCSLECRDAHIKKKRAAWKENNPNYYKNYFRAKREKNNTKEKCLYCSILANGDVPEDTEDILIVDGCYSLIIGNSGEDFGIVIQDKHNGHIMLDKLLKFNFCPMCGKSLKDIEGRTVEE